MYELRQKEIDQTFQILQKSGVEETAMEFQRLMAYYRCAMMEIETKFKVLNEEFSLQYDRNPINSIKTRLKKLPSIIEKMERKNFPMSVSAVEEYLNDVAGIRVVCSFTEDVYTLADALLKQDDIILLHFGINLRYYFIC